MSNIKAQTSMDYCILPGTHEIKKVPEDKKTKHDNQKCWFLMRDLARDWIRNNQEDS